MIQIKPYRVHICELHQCTERFEEQRGLEAILKGHNQERKNYFCYIKDWSGIWIPNLSMHKSWRDFL